MTKEFIFIDESGSPDFFGKRKRPLWLDDNFQPLLILGLVVTRDRRKLRKIIEAFQQKLLADPLYNSIYSLRQPDWFLHAKNDHQEVRIQFFELIRSLDLIKCYAVVARKLPDIFINKHNGNAKEFYFDVLNSLVGQYAFEEKCHYQFYLSRRDSTNTKPFSDAIEKVISKLTTPHNTPFCTYKCDIVRARDYPELSVVDYLLWAVQRYIMKKERRFLTALESKFELIYDLYDFECENNKYDRNNPFLLDKAKNFFE